MLRHRRKFIKTMLSLATSSLGFSSGFFHSKLANAEEIEKMEEVIEKTTSSQYDETLLRLFNDAEIMDSRKIKISRLPRVAENGAFVPITINSSLDNVEKVYILVEKNPFPLSAEFSLSTAVLPRVSARLKIAETCDVFVIIKAKEKLYRISKSVEVTVGGCGG